MIQSMLAICSACRAKLCERATLLAFIITIIITVMGGGMTANAATATPNGDAVLKYLDRSIDWYRRITALDQTPVDSQELLYRETARANALQALQLAFDFAHAQAATIESQSKPSMGKGASANTAARLKQAATAADQRIADIKNQLNDAYHTSKTPADAARQSKLAAELDLATTQRDALSQYASFLVATSNGDATLSDKIDQLEKTVPDVQPTPPTDAAKTSPVGAAAAEPREFHPESAGIITLVSELLSLTSRMDELARLKDLAGTLQQSCDQMRTPLRAQLMDDLRNANAMADTTQQSSSLSTESSDVAKLDADRLKLEVLTSDFKLTSAAGIPLGEQSVLLGSVSESLARWHDALARQYEAAGRSLLFRTIVTAVTVIALIIISELWRRATFRYVGDPRRRRQLMLVRRIVIGVIVVMIIIGSVVTEFGSLATFAGLITAGIAVALQTVILSGVAYFFFIGRFGVRVGDRVTVSGITGDVVEIGLFRIYLMELAGSKSDLQPTGRMIVFSNAVLFQPSAFYKQLPGAEYVWHEVVLTMSPDTDHALAEQRLMTAVGSVLAQYQDAIDRQHEVANQLLHMPLESPRPQARLRFSDAGVEMVIRYPVELKYASQVEDKVTRKLLDAIQQEPKLKMVASGIPRIQSAA